MSAAPKFIDLCESCNANPAMAGGLMCRECVGALNAIDGVRLIPASSVQVQRATYAWEPRIPLGALTLLAGLPGQGKSHLTVELAARITRGELEGDLHGTSASVVMATAEDALSFVMAPRLIAAGAEMERVSFVVMRRDGIDGGISIPESLDQIGSAMDREGARLLVVDPLLAHIPASIDGYKDQHVRIALAPIATLAEELSVAVLGVMHLNKREGGDLFSRLGGSGGFMGAARSVLLVGTDPDDDASQVLAHGKANYSRLAPAVGFRLESVEVPVPGQVGDEATAQVARVEWTGERSCDLSDVLNQKPQRKATEAAESWLTETLAAGPMPAAWIKRLGEDAGHSYRSLERAKKSLGIVVDRIGGFGGSGRWEWSLPSNQD